ncbi:MAG: ABC transporter substrate-binding protein [Chloroflexi bacterium]|nr:ABC transporter substrate-binding protein [Chloroflexota bacterium]
MMVFIGLDDTDTLESRGTGHLARQVAAALSTDYSVLGVTRHQLLFDPRVPYTAKNSSATVVLDANGDLDTAILLERVRAVMLENYQEGSDPGLCVARTVPTAVTEFGRLAQQELVTQDKARALAADHDISLVGLGGTEDGVIGALAAVGLAASGEDGRYVLVGRSRQLSGLQPVSAVLDAGVTAVCTLDGQPVVDGLILTDKLRPARRGGRAVAFVEQANDYWQPLKLD